MNVTFVEKDKILTYMIDIALPNKENTGTVHSNKMYKYIKLTQETYNSRTWSKWQQ